jgi:hypothetical protein
MSVGSVDPVALSFDLMAPRWRGQRGRQEVWYLTLSDQASGVGFWLHHELVSPLQGEPYAHGWAACFRPGAQPQLERFGPAVVPRPRGLPAASGDGLASVPGAVLAPQRATGEAGSLSWDLSWEEGRGLATFPLWAWRREILPAAQVLVVASTPLGGQVGGVELSSARGGVAHIYGHGSAERWAWLHAELGGGDVLEVVAAVSRRGGLRRLPPLAFVQLRVGDSVWPRDPLAASVLFRSRLALPRWSVRGGTVSRRLRVDVTIPEDEAVRVGYVDPDGSTATCTNSERSDAEVVVESRRRGKWEEERMWNLSGCAHAEVGLRP